MSEPKKHAALGLSDTNIDPDILTKEIDHDFFDDPLGGSEGEASEFPTCQVDQAEGEIKICNKMPNEKRVDITMTADETSSTHNLLLMRLEKGEGLVEDALIMRTGGEAYHEDSGRSSSNVTLHLELGKDGTEQSNVDGGAQTEDDFYSMQSNANYPRPKESYQLQQRRRSFGTIQQPQRNGSSTSGKGEQPFQPMNPTDCGLNGHFGDLTSSDSSSTDSGDEGPDESDSDLSDSSESELESLDTDDEEFVDMLEKYFDYIDPDSDCSDLTEVSPLSSLAASPLPPSFFAGLDLNGGEVYHAQGTDGYHNMNIVTDEQLCLATSALKIQDREGERGNESREEFQDVGLSSAAEIDVAVAAVTAVASAVPAAAQLLERDLLRGGKPRLPVVISTTETVIIPHDESDDDNNAPGSMSISGAGTCGTSIDIDDVEDVDYVPHSEDFKGDFGERDPARDKKELDVCFNCCVMEHAKKILSREASPSRKNNGWHAQTKQLEEGNGNSGGNGNNGDDIGRGIGNGGARSRSTWNGKLRAGSSTSATSSSSSTTGSSSTHTCGSGASGTSTGSGLKKAQKNFTFTPEQMRKIERENHILLRKILDTHQKGFHHGHHGNHCHHHRCRNHGHHHHSNGHHGHHIHHQNRVSSSMSLARLRQQKRIEHENNILMKKLQNVKPSKDIGDAFGKPVKN